MYEEKLQKKNLNNQI